MDAAEFEARMNHVCMSYNGRPSHKINRVPRKQLDKALKPYGHNGGNGGGKRGGTLCPFFITVLLTSIGYVARSGS